MSFKKIYNEYIKQPNTENENLLLREICYNINFFVGFPRLLATFISCLKVVGLPTKLIWGGVLGVCTRSCVQP